MNIIKKKFAYLFAMGVFVLGISSSIPVFAASSSNSIIHKREYMTLWVKTDGGNLNVREDASLSAKIVGKLKISIGQTLSRLSPRATPCKQLSLHTAFHGISLYC